MMDAGMSAHVALHVHVWTRRRVNPSLDVVDLVSDLHVRLLAGVSGMECLIIAEAVQVLIVLFKHLHVVLAV